MALDSKRDPEKQSSKDGHYVEVVNAYDPSQESKWTRWGLNLESFKPAPGPTHRYIDGKKVPIVEGDTLLQTKFKNRHLQMIAVGGSIG